MQIKSFFYGLLMIAVAASCTQPKVGAAKMALEKTYPNYSFLRTVFTESMIRAATNVSGIDSSFDISSNTEYLLQFEIQRDARYFVPKTDSLILWDLSSSGLDRYFLWEEAQGKKYVFGLEKEGVLENVVFLESDSNAVKIYEFVGKMPMDKLFNQGFSNFDKLKSALNLNLF